MINYENQNFNVDGRLRPIAKWDVWFRIPVGLCSTLSAAIDWCKSHDMKPELTIVPVPVVISEDGYYEALG